MDYRIEKDTLGEMQVPAEAYWGAQTQRSLENFPIGSETIPLAQIRAFAYLKGACAEANVALGKMDKKRGLLINEVVEEILEGKLDHHFPLKVWQTGSGTQSNMNCNEVIANRANTITAEKLLHPNDHVNMSQSSNDTFPSAMHIAAKIALEKKLLPSIQVLIQGLAKLEADNPDVIKCGRTHLQDATPLRFAQEVSGWRTMLEQSAKQIEQSLVSLSQLAIGGTAVGTGLNAPAGFGEAVAAKVSEKTGLHFESAPNKFHALTSKDALVFAHGALKGLAANLMKIANDIRWLGSGPRCGFGEITLPANEPGSSIMPGKINPTQCEAVTMVAAQVMGNDVTIGIGASQGNFELNVYMPVIIYNFLQSVDLLADAMVSFNTRCVQGIVVNEDKMQAYLRESLMLVTALNPVIGYDKAAQVAKTAFKNNQTLKETAVALGFLSEEEFDQYVDPEKMV